MKLLFLVLFSVLSCSSLVSCISEAGGELAWGSCKRGFPNTPITEIDAGKTRARVSGSAIQIFAIKPNGDTFEEEYILAQLVALHEIELPTAESLCFASQAESPETAPGIFELRPEDCSCAHQYITSMFPGTNTERRYINIIFNCSSQPLLNLTMDVNVVNETQIVSFPQFGSTQEQVQTYTPNTIKLNVQANNWEWSGVPYSYVAIFINLQVISKGEMSVLANSTTELIRGEVVTPNVKFYPEIQRGFVYDGLAYVSPIPAGIKGPFNIYEKYEINNSLALCYQRRFIGSYATNISYDPTFSALFLTPDTSSKSPSTRRGVYIGASVGSLVAVTVIVALVVLGIKSNAFKNMIRPFRARKHDKGSPSSLSGANNTWTASKTPSPI